MACDADDFERLKARLSALLKFLRYAPTFGTSTLTSLGLFFAGLLFLLLLVRSKRIVRQLQIWRDRFQQCGVSPETYQGKVFAMPHVVYVRVPMLAVTRKGLVSSTLHVGDRQKAIQKSLFYVGSTTITLAHRDADRYRKFKQLFTTHAVQAEPSIRYWFHRGVFFDYVSLVLFPCSCAKNVRICENVFLQMWRPGLNYPQTNKLVFQSWGVKQTSLMKKHDFAPQRIGKRLFLKLRRRMRHVQQHFLSTPARKTFSREEAWMIIHDLTTHDGRAWNMQRSLGSSTWSHNHIYALCKLSANLEEPFRSRARSRLAAVLKFRHQDVPKRNQPLVVPFLAHSKFRAFVVGWLRDVRCRFLDALLPFHLPSKSVVEGSHQSVGKLLFSFQTWLKRFESSPGKSFCMCEEVLKQHPHLETIDGHIASPAEKLSMSSHLRKLVEFSAKTMVFPSKQVFLKTTLKLVRKWACIHKFPVHEIVVDWERFVEEQWPMHLQAASHRFTFQDVCRVKTQLRSLVCHCRDHAYQQVMVYCPDLFHRGVRATFEDKDVYEELPFLPQVYRHNDVKRIPSSLVRKYPWGFKLGAPIPRAFIFLKKKKRFQTARSIISYRNTMLAPALKVASLVLCEVTKEVFPETFGRLNLSKLWPDLHGYLRDIVIPWRDVTEFEVVCDDLVGFFNSLPVERIERAVELVFLQYFQKRPCNQHPDGFVFTVHDRQKFSEGRVLRGKARKFRNAVMRQIATGDVKQIVALSFRFAKFTIMGRCFRQLRGSPIGNQISPALCDLTVSVEEAMWAASLDVAKRSWKKMCWFGRYVDNRFLVFPRCFLQREIFQSLVSPTFYREPVVLEACDAGELLGCMVDIHTGTVELRIPNEHWQYRPENSAGSKRLNLASYRSRTCLIKRQAYPRSVVRRQLQELSEVYTRLGFTRAELRNA